MNKKKVTSASIIGAILASVIYLEGGYTDDPDDPGGKTKYGITERVAREYGYCLLYTSPSPRDRG